MKAQTCPFCGYECDSHTCITTEEASPVPGDFTLCLNCGELLVFDLGLALRKPSPDELQEAWKIPELVEAKCAINNRGLLHEKSNLC